MVSNLSICPSTVYFTGEGAKFTFSSTDRIISLVSAVNHNFVAFCIQTGESYTEAILERLTWPRYENYTFNSLAPYGYDAAWAVALMLNRCVDVLKTKVFADGTRRRLEDYNYDDNEMAQLFFDLLNETEFIGLTVRRRL